MKTLTYPQSGSTRTGVRGRPVLEYSSTQYSTLLEYSTAPIPLRWSGTALIIQREKWKKMEKKEKRKEEKERKRKKIIVLTSFKYLLCVIKRLFMDKFLYKNQIIYIYRNIQF